MKSRLLLSLWLLGAVLYTGSTMFLAHAVLGRVGGLGGDRSKSATVALAADAQCQKAGAPEAAPAKTAVVEPQKAVAEPQKAAPAQNSEKPGTPEALNRSSVPSPSGTDAGQEPEQASSPDPWQQRETASPNVDQDQAGAQPDQPEQDEWAHVVAGTADMRSEPSREAPLIYALPAGWQVRVISRQPGWVQIQDSNSGAAGWVESTALAPVGPGEQPGYDPYGTSDGPPHRYADEGYPEDQSWRWRRPQGLGQFGDFVRRALGGW